MKAMVFSDLITSKRACIQLFGISLFVAVFISIGTGTLVTGVAAFAAMIPTMFLFSISAYDEMNGWERFRLTLPITRHQVAYGRYISMLIITVLSFAFAIAATLLIGGIAEILPWEWVPEGLKLSYNSVPLLVSVAIAVQVVMFVVSALVLPIIMRFGVTKGSRLVPVIFILAMLAGVAFFANFVDANAIESAIAGSSSQGVLIAGGSMLVALLIYFASAVLSARLYMDKEL